MREQKLMEMPDRGRLEYHVATRDFDGAVTVHREEVAPVQLAYQIGAGLSVRLDLAAIIGEGGEPVIAYRAWDSSGARAAARLRELEHAEAEARWRRKAMEPAEQHERWVAAMSEWYE